MLSGCAKFLDLPCAFIHFTPLAQHNLGLYQDKLATRMCHTVSIPTQPIEQQLYHEFVSMFRSQLQDAE